MTPPPACDALFESRVTATGPGVSIDLTVLADPLSPEIGAGLWHAGHDLADLVASVPGDWLRKQCVLELGAGVGLPGLAAACLGAAAVTLTDRAAALPLLRLNVDANKDAIDDRGGRAPAVEALDWGDPGAAGDAARRAAPTLGLAADVAYDADAWPGLIRTLVACLRRSPAAQAWLALPARAESAAFLPALAAAGAASRPLRACAPREPGAAAVRVHQVWMKMKKEGRGATTRSLALLDYDWTLIEANSDTVIIDMLGARPTLDAALAGGEGWTGAVAAALAAGCGAAGERARECVQAAAAAGPMADPVAALLRRMAGDGGSTAVIISDANTLFIAAGLAAASASVGATVTNPAVFDGGGVLRLRPLCGPGGAEPAHGCADCPPNLCKGRAAERLLVTHPGGPPDVLVVAGDGANDACSAARAGVGDFVFARTAYPDGRPARLGTLFKEGRDGGPLVTHWAAPGELAAGLEAALWGERGGD